MATSKWGAGREAYERRPAARESHGYSPAPGLPVEQSIGDTGRVTWDRSKIHLNLISQSTVDRALFRFKKTLPEFIWNTAALEGNTFTLPEVRTLLDGVTVGGRRLEEAQQIIALSEALNIMTELVAAGKFDLSEETSKSINAAVTQYEIIDPGLFRGQGVVAGGGGTVQLMDGREVLGDEPGERGERLADDYVNLRAAIAELADPRERALAYFASAARSQFYYDGNKRTSRIMMAGELMSSGYEAVSVPVSRRLEFNRSLTELFVNDDATEVMAFLATCVPPSLE